ncbi:hypothetical protein B0H21DRAFT_735738 [Amylocystis lapponica]|nr:hypothetical protein B0H21DRAFT_735738 [Amylocystis lapponica]
MSTQEDSHAQFHAGFGTDPEKAESMMPVAATSLGAPGTRPLHAGSPLLFYRPLPRRTGGQRFLRAFVWIALALLLTPAIINESRRFARVFTKYQRERWDSDVHSDLEHVPGSCTQSADWSFDMDTESRFAHSARTSFDLPVDSDLLYLVSRGSTSLAHGTVEISDSGEPGSDVVKVEISAHYDTEDVFDLVKVCMLQPSEGHNGVGIFAPLDDPSHRGRERIQYHIKARLPRPSSDYPVLIKRFETDLPIFVHHVGDIQNSVIFNEISLKSSNVPFKIDSLTSGHTTITSSNGPIEGSFNSSGEIVLTTSNAFIKAEVGLTNYNPEVPTKLCMKTSNSPIGSNISLVSGADDGTGGSFHVLATTSNSPLAIAFPVSPVDSILHFTAHTSNSPARAVLHKTFEGAFSLKSSPWFGSVVNADNDAEDPAGRGRRRVVDVQRVSRGVVEGSARWSPAQENQRGWVEVTTSNMGVTLDL